uniref:NF-kappa-B inhibitor alpha n=1 Tax=Paramormyrops kingsleyae TaxID=1676925 RepID=A0A3B3R3S4_9TELE|nr:NF-kappa-B inhibitor beta [Paramormyrops kingsleyae]
MEGIQSQVVRSQTQSDNGNQPARPLNSYGFGKQVGSDGVGAEDWCDSGLECLNGALSLETPFCTESEHPPTLKSTPFDICSRKTDSEHEPTDSCISLGNGERLDSALGHSITDEMLGCISQGIGTIQLSEPDSVSGDRSGEVIGGQVEAYPPEEVFNTLNFVSEDGDTALHLALIHEHLTFVHYLVGVITLDQNWTPYLDIQNDLGQTALHLAVIVDQPDCVKALLWGGASAEIQERGGNTPLHLAVRESRMACVRELTCSGIRPDHLRIINYSGVSALHLAVQKGNEEIVQMLLEGGADVNQRDLSSGRSPLHWAVESQSPTLVRLLLRAGAAVDQPSYAGHSPLYCALHRPNAEVQALLRDGGGTEMHGGEDEDEEDRESEEDEFDDLIINGHRVL